MRPNLVPTALLFGLLSMTLVSAPMPLFAAPPADCTTDGDNAQISTWRLIVAQTSNTTDHSVISAGYHTMYNTAYYFQRCAGNFQITSDSYAFDKENQARAILFTATLIIKLGSDAPNLINFGSNDYRTWPTELRKIARDILKALLDGTLTPTRRAAVEIAYNDVNALLGSGGR
jgi:hypothetical protein